MSQTVPFLILLAVLLFVAAFFLLFLVCQIAFCAIRRALGRGGNAGTNAQVEEQQGAAVARGFVAGFRREHLFIFAVFAVVYSLLAWGIWGGYYHSFKSILMVNCGPFATAILDSTPEHWKTAWRLFAFCAPFLFLGVFCQWVRLPFQRFPRPVAVVMWVIGWMIWFDAAIWSYLLAM